MSEIVQFYLSSPFHPMQLTENTKESGQVRCRLVKVNLTKQKT